MDASNNQILKEIPGMIRLYKDGKFLKLSGTDVVPADIDPSTRVQSKDVVISQESNVSARLYIPNITTNSNINTLPLLFYFHGGCFIVETTASPKYHNFLNLVSSESNVVVVSVDYRTAPDHPVPTCFEDSWEAIKWVAQHANGNGSDPWLNQYPDFSQVFFSGDSAGGNISHHMAIRAGLENFPNGMRLKGIILLHPYFWGNDRIGSESSHPWKQLIEDLWMFAYPGTTGLDDPLFNPDKDPKVLDLGCSKVLVCVAGNDILKDRGVYYKDILSKIGWKGDIEVIEDKGEDHIFFLSNPSSDNTCNLRKRICSFINK